MVSEFVPDEPKSSHRMKALRQRTVDFGFLAGMSGDDYKEIASDVMKDCEDWIGVFCEEIIDRQRFKTSVAYSVPLTLESAQHSGRIPIISLMTIVASCAIAVSHSSDSIFSISPLNRPMFDAFVNKTREGYTPVLVDVPPEERFEDATKFQLKERIDDLSGRLAESEELYRVTLKELSELKDSYQKLQGSESRWKNKAEKAEDELSDANNHIAKLEEATKTESIVVVNQNDDKVDELLSELASAKHQLREARAASEEAKQGLHLLERYSFLIENENVIVPATPKDSLALAKAAFPESLAFSNKAERDVAEWNGSAVELWNALRALAIKWLPALQNSEASTRTETMTLTGFEITANEGRYTRNSKKLSAMRRAVIDGQETEATHHLKGGSVSPSNVLRIYFAYNQDKQRIDIVRCGPHLETAGSKRKSF